MGYAKNNFDEKTMARAKGQDLPISTKVSIEVCNFLRYKTTTKAKQILERVITKDTAIPFKRFNWDVGHRPGDMGPGRYPLKASEEILRVIKQVESNAADKGLATENLLISHLVANKAERPWRNGRQSRRKAKRTHVEIMVKEAKPKAKPQAKPKAEASAPASTTETAKTTETEKADSESNEKVSK
jgi:large subunit ribosomal protein L22